MAPKINTIDVETARQIVKAHDDAEHALRMQRFKAKAAEVAGNQNVQKGAFAAAGLGLGVLLANALA